MMGRSDKERWRRTATIRSGKEESVYIWGNQVFGVDQGGGGKVGVSENSGFDTERSKLQIVHK